MYLFFFCKLESLYHHYGFIATRKAGFHRSARFFFRRNHTCNGGKYPRHRAGRGLRRNISPASRSYTWTTREWGVVYLYTNIEERACDLAVCIIENRATVRSAATQFGISKSTVHKDLTERLPRLDPALYKQVRQLLDINKAERHIRGGLATRRKYKGE